MLKPLTEQVVEKSKDMMDVCMKELGRWENIIRMDEINNKLDKLLVKVEKLS